MGLQALLSFNPFPSGKPPDSQYCTISLAASSHRQRISNHVATMNKEGGMEVSVLKLP